MRLLCDHFLQGMSQLVGTGGRLETAADSLEAADGFFRLHAFYQSTDSLQITVASAGEFYGINDTILNSTSIEVEQVPFVLYIICKTILFKLNF